MPSTSPDPDRPNEAKEQPLKGLTLRVARVLGSRVTVWCVVEAAAETWLGVLFFGRREIGARR